MAMSLEHILTSGLGIDFDIISNDSVQQCKYYPFWVQEVFTVLKRVY